MSSSTSIAVTAIVATLVGAATGAGLAHAYALGRAQAASAQGAVTVQPLAPGASPSTAEAGPAARSAVQIGTPPQSRPDAQGGITRVACRSRSSLQSLR
jgi:hypothetical protein